MAGLKGLINELDQPLWSRVAFAAAALSSLAFFATAPGDKQVSNLTSPRQLPGKNAFAIWGLRLYVHPLGTAANAPLTRGDMGEIQKGHVELKIDDTVQFETLVMDVPGAMGMGGFFTDGAAEDQCLLNGTASRNDFRRFSKPIIVSPGQHFEVKVNYPTATAAISLAGLAYCFLDGVYIRRAL